MSRFLPVSEPPTVWLAANENEQFRPASPASAPYTSPTRLSRPPCTRSGLDGRGIRVVVEHVPGREFQILQLGQGNEIGALG